MAISAPRSSRLGLSTYLTYLTDPLQQDVATSDCIKLDEVERKVKQSTVPLEVYSHPSMYIA
jgi:hypothetical protein